MAVRGFKVAGIHFGLKGCTVKQRIFHEHCDIIRCVKKLRGFKTNGYEQDYTRGGKYNGKGSSRSGRMRRV